MSVSRPVLRWHGGKWRLAPWIISHFPRHQVYVEPFGGAASVLLRKEPLAAEVYNDLDGTVVNVFRMLRDPASAGELVRRLRLTPFARSEFDWSYEPGVDAVDLAHKTIVRSFMGHGSDSVTRSCRTGFRAKMTDERALPAQAWKTYLDAVEHFTSRLLGVVIEQRDASEIIDRYDTKNTLFYFDPPYMHATRSSLVGRSKNTHGYKHELDDAAHLALLERAKNIEGMAIISGYMSDIYNEALTGWKCVTRAALADGARARTEALWISPAAVAGDTDLLGAA
jgi:DNA adenine methylase